MLIPSGSVGNPITIVGNEHRQSLMYPVYALEELPDPCCSSLFLSGPTPNAPETLNWRVEALSLLTRFGYAGAVIVPEPRDDQWNHVQSDQADWEAAMRARADLIVHWVPRESVTMPGFTINVEFGENYDSCRSLYGRPPGLPKCLNLDACWEAMTQRAPQTTLQEILGEAMELLGAGSPRYGAERDVPLAVWRSEPFMKWFQAHSKAGHTLRGFQVRYILPHGARHPASPVFAFLAWAAVEVAGEGRIKSNEVFFARRDAVAIVPISNPGTRDAEAFFVQEYRIAARNPSGFVVEPPGGSSREVGLPLRAIAVEELSQEMGLVVDPVRLVDLGSRQSAPTLCTHHTHVFALALTATEAEQLRQFAAEQRVFGEDDEERVRVIRQPLIAPFDPSLDWSSIGMLISAEKTLDKY